MNRRNPARHSDARQLAHHKSVVLEKRTVVVAVRQVALAAAVEIQHTHMPGIQRVVYTSGRQRLHDLQAVHEE
ncbi:MAG: hypothetical protein ACK5QX_02905, partial [bacterium]